MKKLNIFLLALIIVVLPVQAVTLTKSTPLEQVQTPLSSQPQDWLIDNQIIVKMKPHEPLLSNYPQKKLNISKLLKHDYISLTIDDQRHIKDVMIELKGLGGVLGVQQNGHIELTSTTPNDRYFSKQWHHTANGLYSMDAWDEQTGSAEVVIAVIDSGVALEHPDLKNNIWVNSDEIVDNGIDDDNNGYIDDMNGWDFAHNNNDPNPELNGLDDDGDGSVDEYGYHGTGVAGVIAAEANNSTGVAGMMWDASIMALQQSNADDPTVTTTVATVAEAVYYAITNEADIINMSFTAGTVDYDVLREALAVAADENIFLVNSAPNGEAGSSLDDIIEQYGGYYPLCYDDVLGVTSYYYYNYGPYRGGGEGLAAVYGACVDIMGAHNVYSTNVHAVYGSGSAVPIYHYAMMAGTSFATPTVAGVAGLLLSQNEALTIDQLTDTILSTATAKDSTEQYNLKLANADAALASLVSSPQ